MDGLFSGKQETSHLGSLKWMTCFSESGERSIIVHRTDGLNSIK